MKRVLAPLVVLIAALAYAACERVVELTPTTPDASFTPDAGPDAAEDAAFLFDAGADAPDVDAPPTD